MSSWNDWLRFCKVNKKGVEVLAIRHQRLLIYVPLAAISLYSAGGWVVWLFGDCIRGRTYDRLVGIRRVRGGHCCSRRWRSGLWRHLCCYVGSPWIVLKCVHERQVKTDILIKVDKAINLDSWRLQRMSWSRTPAYRENVPCKLHAPHWPSGLFAWYHYLLQTW